jgi:SAM-dependent methyltransferase
MSTDSWIERVVASLREPQLSPWGDLLPAFPDSLLQANTTGLAGEAAIRQAGAFHNDVVSALAAVHAPLLVDQKVLDFGCGWGRIGRMFLRETRANCLQGLDVDPEFADLCRYLFGSDNFHVCSPHPPSLFAAAEFNLIVTYSVFSHLSENAVRAWLLEFHRLLKPGGFVAFTTRHESFLRYVDWARTAHDVDDYTQALGRLFEDISVPRTALARGQFVHATSPGVSGGGVRDETFYGETWIPAAYLVREFGTLFELIATCFDPARYDQVTYVIRKRL